VFPTIWEADPVHRWLTILAHQGGWDEALLALTPVALLVGLVYVATVAARRRADATTSVEQDADARVDEDAGAGREGAP
jgi:hypothetical protein